MAHFIDKDALVEKIDKRLEERQDARDEARWNDEYWPESDFYIRDKEDEELLTIINTLEVKEVDLEKELDLWMELNQDDAGYFNTLKLAEHFFELGLKAQKGE